MGHYINKADIMAELEKLYNLEYNDASNLSCGKKIILRHIMSFLDTIETKEVDLEKEMDEWRHNHFCGARDDKGAAGEWLTRKSQLDIAKHFFEFGLKVQKEGK